jgi:molybdate transport system permease protein
MTDLFPLYLTIKVSIMATIGISLLGIPIAYLLAKRSFHGKNIIEMLFMLPLIMPPTVLGYYLINVFGRQGIIGQHVYQLTGYSIAFTWHAAVLASMIVAMPFIIKTAKAAIESINPDFEKVAFTLGKSEAETALQITLPLAKKGIFAGVLLAFARALGEFGATLMLAGNIPGKTNTMPIAIYDAVLSGNQTQANLLVLILTLTSIIILYTSNKFIQ